MDNILNLQQKREEKLEKQMNALKNNISNDITEVINFYSEDSSVKLEEILEVIAYVVGYNVGRENDETKIFESIVSDSFFYGIKRGSLVNKKEKKWKKLKK